MIQKQRCTWAGNDAKMIAYHDTEWGRPVHDDNIHFEFLILESAQAGLNWSTILKKREGYCKAYKNFDPIKVAEFDNDQIEKMMANPDIVRNRRKIESSIKNAQCFLKIQAEFGSFDKYCWGFVGGKPLKNNSKSLAEAPSTSPQALAFSKDLKKRGLSFVGPTITYAYMQAVGLVNDHTIDCFVKESIDKQ